MPKRFVALAIAPLALAASVTSNPAPAQTAPARFAVVVVVGDRKAIEAPVRALNLGPVKVMTVDGALGPAK